MVIELKALVYSAAEYDGWRFVMNATYRAKAGETLEELIERFRTTLDKVVFIDVRIWPDEQAYMDRPRG